VIHGRKYCRKAAAVARRRSETGKPRLDAIDYRLSRTELEAQPSAALDGNVLLAVSAGADTTAQY
jgi:hypothetical protein